LTGSPHARFLALQQLAELGSFDAWLGGYARLRRILVSFAPALSLGALLALCLEAPASFTKWWALFGKYPALGAGWDVFSVTADRSGRGPVLASAHTDS
jgi:hypothetical protein